MIFIGIVIGIFLNILIYRLPRDLSVLKNLKLSFLTLLRSNLKQFIIVILVTVAAFIIILLLNWTGDLNPVFYLVITSQTIFSAALIVIFFIDFYHYLILDKVIYPMLPLAFFLNWMRNNWLIESAFYLVIAAVGGFMFFALQYYLSKGKWIGGGDMKLGALLGFMLGIKGLLVTIFFAYVIGALTAMILIILKRKNLQSVLPLAIFLTPMAFFAMFFSDKIIAGYLRLLF